MADVKISELSAASAPSDADTLPLVQSGATKKLTMELLREYTRDNQRWMPVDASYYTATPASTSQITCSTTSDFAVGLPLKYVISGVTYYGIVTAVVADTSIDVAGAALTADISTLYVGTREMVRVLEFHVSSTYGDGANDLLATDENRYHKWLAGVANLVAFSGVHKTADTGANQPKVNVKVNAQLVSTADTNNGIQLSTAGTWVDNSAVAISTSFYDINRGEAIEIACTAAGSNGDASDLTVLCVFVLQ